MTCCNKRRYTMWDKEIWEKIGLFAGGLLFGTAGLKVLSSDDAKKAYTHTTAAVLRAKSCILAGSEKLKENCDDIYAGAKDINEERAEKKAAEEDIADASEK